MGAREALVQLGGVATHAALIALSTRHAVATAVAAGVIMRAARGRYVLPEVSRQRTVAATHCAVLSHLSAAQHHGWAVKHPPERTWMTVPRNRKVTRETQAEVHVFYADLADDEIGDGVTGPLRTVLDCARTLPFDEALTVADSALREHAITPAELRAGATALRGRGAREARRVASYADGRAANPFESVLRAIVIESGALDVEPQVPVETRTMVFHPDLVDVRRHVAIEADSWSFHRDKQTHDRDCVRHTALALAGWLVLRFTWHQVMSSRSYVVAVLEDAARESRHRSCRDAPTSTDAASGPA